MSAIAMTEQLEPFELLALATARTPDMQGGGRGGKGRLSAQDVLAAMSFGYATDGGDPARHDGPTQLALAKYTLDEFARYRCGIIWRVEVARLAVLNEWNQEKGRQRLQLLAEATLRFHLDGAVCRGCHGAKVTPDQRDCPTCDGRGIQPIPDVWWARELDVHRTNVGTWLPRVQVCLRELQDWEIRADEALRAGLRRGVHSE